VQASNTQPTASLDALGKVESRVRRQSLPHVPLLLSVLSIVILFAAWVLAAGYVAGHYRNASTLLPSPADVVRDFPGIAVFRGPNTPLTVSNAWYVVVTNTWTSLVRLVSGIAIGTALGIGIALVLGWSHRIRAMVEAPLLLIRTIPLLALIPLFLTWFGGTDTGIITYIAFAAFSMLLINTLEAIRNVSPVVQAYARTLGASQLRVYRTVVVPAIIPEMVGGIRVMLGLSWAILLAGEFVGAQSGIGYILIQAQAYSYTSRMVLIVLLIMLYTFVMDRSFSYLARYVTRWMPH
jgi:ABC-type nitrate/sulfonate/bicarbonate transport system permease component